jgi:WD40 repeat protein
MDAGLVVSGGVDGAVKLWSASSGACLHTLRGDRRYERTDITGITGITEAQRDALLALGAEDRHDRSTSGPAGWPRAGLTNRIDDGFRTALE